ncbi:MAG: hypothetical protein IH931_03550, partial [candidate division Zixibacteria bacterium]|nr:hypothetical protein [candidate division Zixibacteria bacterium]
LETKLAAIPFSADIVLPGNAPEKNISVASLTTKITRKEASATLGDKAAEYLNSLMIGTVRVMYKVDEDTIRAEIAQFASTDDAYGFYSRQRPDGITLDGIGSESFFYKNQYKFIKGEYAVSLSLKRKSKDALKSFRKLAGEIAGQIAQSPRAQQFFILFPFGGQVASSRKYYSRDFMGVDGLDSVYTINYASDSDTLILFLTMDTSGAKFVNFSKWGKSFGKAGPVPAEFDFPSGHSIAFEHPDKGQIVAGIVRKKIAGVIGYKRGSGSQLCSRWVKGFR